ncbi:hypothetical protein FACS1894172_10300 [Spirochaetia bacterium]|nr:hypothetical protein FACS1894164_12980 [Spirochaetia bacterium]GHU32873.1 hypothetical protein FACS1894172_10300 [Spirochaetia bacterium]
MPFDQYILIDYENTQEIIMDGISEKTKLIIAVGENQNKLPLDLVQKTQPFGLSVDWCQIKGGGKRNALDFFIAYCLGTLTASDKGKEYIIYSKDTGYDPLIEHLSLSGINVRRIVNFVELHGKNGTKLEYAESVKKIRENLSKIDQKKRPKNKKGLSGHIKALLNLEPEKIDSIIEELFIMKIIYEENGHIKYSIETTN